MNNNEELDMEEVKRLFNIIRNEEIKNVKTQRFDDKQMVSRITQFLTKEVGGKEQKNEI